MAERKHLERGAELQAATMEAVMEMEGEAIIEATTIIGTIIVMGPQVDEETETLEEGEVLEEEEVAGGVDDPVQAWVLSVDAIAKEDSSMEHSHPRSQGSRGIRRSAAMNR